MTRLVQIAFIVGFLWQECWTASCPEVEETTSLLQVEKSVSLGKDLSSSPDLVLTESCLRGGSQFWYGASTPVLVTSDIVIVQDQPIEFTGIVNRYLALKKPDGSCRVEGMQKLHCSPSNDKRDLCGVPGAPKDCITNANTQCRGTEGKECVDPFMWSELSIGLLGGACASKQSHMKAKLNDQPRGGLQALVLGTGTGIIPGYLSHRLPSSNTIAVDINADTMFAAEHFFHAYGNNSKFVIGDAGIELRKQKDASLDVIYIDAYDPRDNAPNELYTPKSIAIAKNKLRPGGRLVLLLLPQKEAGISTLPRSLEKHLEALGFEDINIDLGEGKTYYPLLMGQKPGESYDFFEDDVKAELLDWHADTKFENECKM